MTKQATLGPIDLSVNNPLNPQIAGAAPDAKASVSVEAINGFIEMAQKQCGLRWFAATRLLLSYWLRKCTLWCWARCTGRKHRFRCWLEELEHQVKDPAKVDPIIGFLCSESGSHDYTIHRREARDNLNLRIEKPDDALDVLIKSIYDDIEAELLLNLPFKSNSLRGTQNASPYQFRRMSMIESTTGGSYFFVSEGQMIRQQIEPQPGVVKNIIQDQRQFEGWRHDNP